MCDGFHGKADERQVQSCVWNPVDHESVIEKLLSLTFVRPVSGRCGVQYCQTRSVNILTRVCRELTRLSRSQHTLVNTLTIDFTISKIVLLMETKPNQYGIVRILTRVYSQNID